MEGKEEGKEEELRVNSYVQGGKEKYVRTLQINQWSMDKMKVNKFGRQ